MLALLPEFRAHFRVFSACFSAFSARFLRIPWSPRSSRKRAEKRAENAEKHAECGMANSARFRELPPIPRLAESPVAYAQLDVAEFESAFGSGVLAPYDHASLHLGEQQAELDSDITD